MSKTVFSTSWLPVQDPGQEYSELEPVYAAVKSDNGAYYLEKVGDHNVYNAIQSHADETDLKALLARCAASGDYSLVNQVVPQFGDISGIPWDFTEANNRAALAVRQFESLDPKVKSLFKDFRDYARQVVNGKMDDDVELSFKELFKPVQSAPDAEVSSDE